MTRWLRVSLLALVIASAATAEAQSKLNFPRLIPPNELSTTGFSLVNTGSSFASVTFICYGTNGSVVTQVLQSVPAKGQLALLGSEAMPNVTEACWVQMLSSSSEIQGFELVGDFARVVDGAGPAAESTQLAVIDFSKDDILHIVNASPQSGTVQVVLNDRTGASLGTRSIALTAFQPASLRLGELSEDPNVHLVSITANVSISAGLTTILPGGLDIGLTNAVAVSGAPSTLLFPFAPNGAQGSSNWTTIIGIANVTSATQTIALTFTPENGAPINVQRALAPGASVGDSVANLFGLPATSFMAGWVRVTGSGALTGAAMYRDLASGSLAVVPSQSTGSTRLFFGHIACLSPWYTGIALLNTTTTVANVEVYAIDRLGQFVGEATFSLGPSRRTALLSELVPAVLQRVSDGGWVFVRTTNNVPLQGFELFGHAIAPILANVQGFAVPATSTFTPPSIPTSSVSIERISFMNGTNAETQFKPNNGIVYDATITGSSGANGTVPVTFSVNDPRNNVLFTIPVSVTLAASVHATLASYIPANALNGTYTFTASLVYQGQTITKSATFDVSGGITAPTVEQGTPVTLSTLNVPQSGFRPGETIRFLILTANFTGEQTPGTVNYQLTGPGLFNAGSGTTSFSVPAGLGSTSVDMVLPPFAVPGLYTFSSMLTASGTSSTKRTTATVVPESSLESITVDGVFVSDSLGIPKGGFPAGSDIKLNVWTRSLFPIPVPATVRYTVTGPNNTTLMDEQWNENLRNGGTLNSIPLNIISTAISGTYTFRATINYQDNNDVTQTTTSSTNFDVGNNPPALPQAITSWQPFIDDINVITRTAFSPGEAIFLNRVVYSSFISPVSGTVRYRLTGVDGNGIDGMTLMDQTINTTFSPGLNTSYLGVNTNLSLASGVYTFVMTATAQGETSTRSTTFLVAGGGAQRVD
jgi:hypothetical protein